jgi:hypothetical protein
MAERAFGAGVDREQEAFLITMLQVVTAMRASRELEGLVRRPLEVLWTRGAIAAVHSPLAPDVAILDLHRRPSVLRPGLEVIGGLLALWPFVRSRKRGPAASEAPAATLPPMMLLNLPPQADAAAIEHAAPLGAQEDVRAQLAASLPGITFDDRGRGRFTVRAGSVVVDVRSDEPVHTAIVVVHGNAGPAVARLLDESGWRAYAPKRGAFLTINDLRGTRE